MKIWLIRGALIVLGLGVALLVVELGLRLAGYDPLSQINRGRSLFLRPTGNPNKPYELTPNSSGFAWGAHVRVNSHGFRGREYSLEKQSNTKRVVVIGDSVTFGNELKEEDTYPSQLESLFKEQGHDIDVLNLGVGGYDTVYAVSQLQDIGLSFKPDVVVYGFCINDLGSHSVNLAYLEGVEALARSESLVSRSRLFQLFSHRSLVRDAIEESEREELTLLRDPQDPVLASLLSEVKKEAARDLELPERAKLAWYEEPERFGRLEFALEKLQAAQRSHGFRVIVVIIPLLHPARAWKLALKTIEHESEKFGFETENLYESFESLNFKDLRIGDLIHFNRRGHEAIARRLSDRIVKT